MEQKSIIIQQWETFLKFDLQESQKQLFQKMIDDARVIKITSLSEIFSRKEISEIKKAVKPQKKQCYKNASNFLSFLVLLKGREDVRYCEGVFTCYGIPLDHAFNKIGDKYVDITAELALGGVKEEEEYVVLGEWELEEVVFAENKSGYYGGIYKNKTIESLTKKQCP